MIARARTIRRLLVANRGEIAIRAFRAVTATINGTIIRIAVATATLLEGGDLILEIRPSGSSASPEADQGN